MEKKRRQVRTREVLPVRLRGKDSSGKVFDDLAHTLDVDLRAGRLGLVFLGLQSSRCYAVGGAGCARLRDSLSKEQS